MNQVKPPKLGLIAAMGNHRVIGLDNQMPWHLPADLSHFKQLTLEKAVVMGRKTYQSIGKPLPHRQNIVVTRDADFRAPGCDVVHSIDEAVTLVSDSTEIMIIGGAQLYVQALPMVNTLYLTFIHHDFAGDTFFPVWDEGQWHEIAREDHQANEKNPFDYSFVSYSRRVSDHSQLRF